MRERRGVIEWVEKEWGERRSESGESGRSKRVKDCIFIEYIFFFVLCGMNLFIYVI